MGLDMYIYRAAKPHLSDTEIYLRNDIDGVILPENEIDNPMYCQLAPYLQPVQVKNEYYNMEKIREDFGLSSKAHICSYSADGIGVWDNGGEKRITISVSDIEDKYTVEKIEKSYVCNLERVHYWRKEYDVQEWFHDNLSADYIENCGYYILSEELIEDFNESFNEYIEPEEPTEESALFYHEWY